MKAKINVEKVVDYLARFKDNINELYEWNNTSSFAKLKDLIDEEKLSTKKITSNYYENEIFLKEYVHRYLSNINYQTDEFKQISKWIIKDWGGIKAANDNTLDKIIEIILNEKTVDFKNIASISKVLSYLKPYDNIIYDSRVAYSLNWILLLTNSTDKFFPVPAGRNNRLKAFDIDVLIRLKNIELFDCKDSELTNKSRIISNRDKRLYIRKEDAYTEMNNLIKDVSNRLWGERRKLYHTEMILFSIADNKIFKEIQQSVKIRIGHNKDLNLSV